MDTLSLQNTDRVRIEYSLREDVKLTDAGTVVRVFLVFNASVERLVLATEVVDADGARLIVLS